MVTAFEGALDRLKKTQSGEHGTKALSCALVVCLPGLKTWGHHEVRRNTKTPCTQSEQRHCLAHMLSFPSIFLTLVSPVSFLHLRSQCCQLYLWSLKLSKLQFDVKSLIFARELPLLQAAPFSPEDFTCFSRVKPVQRLYFTCTHQVRNEVEPVGSKEAVSLIGQIRINLSLSLSIF